MASRKLGLVKIAVMGDGGCGKTATTIQFVANHFVEYYDPTIEDSYRKQVVIGSDSTGGNHTERIIPVEVLDTAGQDDFSPLRDSWIRSSDAFMLIFSLANSDSLSELDGLVKQIRRTKDGEDTVIHVVGNKKDLENQRQVSYKQGLTFTKSIGAQRYTEISAKTRDGLVDAWHCLIEECAGDMEKPNSIKKNYTKRHGCVLL